MAELPEYQFLFLFFTDTINRKHLSGGKGSKVRELAKYFRVVIPESAESPILLQVFDDI